MLFDYLNATSLPVLGAALIVLIVVGAQFGMAIGRFARRRSGDKDAGELAAAALGLLALLIAFTYSMAVARYDLRRHLVLEEANAIGSTANFALMLPAADQPAILDALCRYTQVRLELGVPYDAGKLERDVATSNALLSGLWRKAVAETAAMPQSLPLYRYVASLNQTNNVAEARITALRNHVPVVILLMLAATAIIAMGFFGYSAAVSGVSRQISSLIMAALLAFLIVVTQDLARPDRGAIEVSNQALRDALAAIPAPVAQ